jgi:membrane associated rhomboid family serine protease
MSQIRTTQVRIGGPLTPAVKTLLILNCSIFLTQQILNLFYPDYIIAFMGLSHAGFIDNRFVWQIFTYMFVHSGWMHIIFNMLTLWFFGGELELYWGTRRFVQYYLISGIGAGVFIALLNFYISMKNPGAAGIPTVGASGALFALLLAFGMIWPNREVLLFFVIPVKVKYVVIVFGLISFFSSLNTLSGKEETISHIGHLGGMITGFILFQLYRIRKPVRKKGNLLSRLLRKFRNQRKQQVINARIRAKETIDRLLDKIAREGMASLTADEKRDLDWARKHYYPPHDETIH